MPSSMEQTQLHKSVDAAPVATTPAAPRLYQAIFLFSCVVFFGLLAAGLVFQLVQYQRLPNVWRHHLAEADDSLQRGDYGNAIKQVRIAARIAPSDEQAWLRLGVAAQGAGNTKQAIAAFRRVLKINRAHPGAHFALGALYLQQERLEPALQHARLAAQLQPQLAQAHQNLAAALLKLGKRDEAISSLHRALALNPDLPGARESLASLGALLPDMEFNR